MRFFLLMTKMLLAFGICQTALFAKPKNVLHLYGIGERPHPIAFLSTITLLEELAEEHEFTLTQAKNSNFVANIEEYDLVLFNNTAFGSFKNDDERDKIEEWMTGGGKAIGFCHTCDVRGTWDWWGEVMCGGAWYKDDFFGAITLNLDPQIEKNPALKAAWDANGLGKQIEFPKTNVFVFNVNPRHNERVTMLLTVDQGNTDVPDHPFTWHTKVGEGEFIYTAIGHQQSDFDNGWMRKATWAWMQYLTGDYNAVGVGEKRDAPFVRLEMKKRQIRIKDGGRHSVRVFDLQGRLLRHWSGSGEKRYAYHGLQAGIYYLRVKSENMDYTRAVTIH